MNEEMEEIKNHFFNSIVLQLNQLFPQELITVDSLKNNYYDFVKNNLENNFKMKNYLNLKQFLFHNSVTDGCEMSDCDEDNFVKNYIKTMEENFKNFHGNLEVEGRIICEMYNIRLHLMQLTTVSCEDQIIFIWTDQVIHKLSVDVIELDKNISKSNLEQFSNATKIVCSKVLNAYKNFWNMDNLITKNYYNFTIESQKNKKFNAILSTLLKKSKIVSLCDALYNIISTCSIPLLKNFLEKIEAMDKYTPNDVDIALAKAYHELKFNKNIKLSENIEFVVVSKLIDLRFFAQKNMDISKKPQFLEKCIEKKIDETIQYINYLQNYAGKNGLEIDDLFMVRSKLIAQNIETMKRYLTKTYENIPWEEIEFCLVNLIACIIKPNEVDIIYKLVLDKDKLLSYLKEFGKRLSNIKHFIPENISTKLNNQPRIEVMQKISENSIFDALCKDYDIIRNIYSLRRIQSQIKLAIAVDIKENDKLGKLVIERTLQVIGEFLKNTVESPNVSEDVHELLLLQAPKNLKTIVISIRDSLSHVHSLSQKVELEATEKLDFFQKVQNDLRKIETAITHTLYRKKIKAVGIFLDKIIETKGTNLHLIQRLTSNLDDTVVENICEDSSTHELNEVIQLVTDLKNMIPDLTDEENDIFNQINDIINCTTQTKSIAAGEYEKEFNKAKEIMELKQFKNNDYSSLLVNIASGYQKSITKQEDTLAKITDIENCLTNIEDSLVRRKIFNSEMNFIINDILLNICLKANRIQHVYNMKEKIDKPKSNMIRKTNISEMVQIVATTFNDKDKKSLENGFEIHNLRIELLYLLNDLEIEYDKKVEDRCKQIFVKLGQKANTIGKLLKDKKYNKCKQLINCTLHTYHHVFDFLQNAKENNLMLLKDSFKIIKKSKIFNQSTVLILEDIYNKTISENISKRIHILKEIIDPTQNILQLLTENKNIQSAVEMLILEITEIMSIFAFLGENKLFFDDYSPILFGKSLRDYLAHGNALFDISTFDSNLSIAYSALKLINEENLLLDTKLGRLEEGFYVPCESTFNLEITANHAKLLSYAQNSKYHEFRNSLSNCDLGYRNIFGLSALHFAIQGNDLRIVQFVCQNITNLSSDKNIFHNLHKINIQSRNIFEYLVKEHIVLVNYIGPLGNTFLHNAVIFGNEEIVQAAIEMDADVNFVNENNKIPLNIAAEYGHFNVFKLLFEKSTNMNHKEAKDDETKKLITRLITSENLYLASRCNHFNIVEFLVANNVDVNSTGGQVECTGLHAAAISGGYDIIKLLLQNKANINAITSDDDSTPLYLACDQGYSEIVEILIENGANVNAALSDDNFTPLHTASENDYLDIVKMLIQNKADVNVVTSDDEATPLHVATINGCSGVVEELLNNGADVNAGMNFNNFSSIHIASQTGNACIVSMLIDHQADVNIKTYDKEITPLHLAAEQGNVNVVELLLRHNACIHAKISDNECTPLHTATEFGHFDIVKMLIDHGAEVDATLSDGNFTPLHNAILNGYLDIVELLIDHGADVNVTTSDDNFSALYMAAQEGYTDIVKILISHGANVNIGTANDNMTPLYFAAEKGYYEICEILVNNNADVNAELKNKKGNILHIAVRHENDKIVQLLLKKKVNVNNVISRDNCTALHCAAQNGFYSIAKMLINNAADVNAVLSNNNETSLYVAAQNGFTNIVKELLMNNADVDAKTKIGHWTALHVATENGHYDIVELLLKYKADVNSSTEGKDETALHIAILNNYIDIVKILLSKNADVNAVMKFDYSTPLLIATVDDNVDIVELLLKNGANVDYGTEDNNLTAIQIASLRGCLDIVQLLIQYKVNVNVIHDGQFSPLYAAAQNGHDEIVEILIRHGADVNFSTANSKSTPLHIATEMHHLNVVKILLSNRSNIKAVNAFQHTALDLATVSGNQDIIQVLQDAEVNSES